MCERAAFVSIRSSVWIIVCMSFERYLAVSRPLRASQMCTTKRAKWVTITSSDFQPRNPAGPFRE